jgi:hypothetical protein
MIFDDPNRAVKRAIMVAKGLGRAIGPLPGDRAPYSAAMPMLAGGGAVGQHPASMLPGVHVSGSPMGFASGGDVEPANETGFDAWHGTPHEFPAERLIQHPTGQQEHVLASQPMPEGASVVKEFPLGRFRSDKIGTGEGAQAYGHGLYLGEEGTARGYRDALTKPSAITNFYQVGDKKIRKHWSSSEPEAIAAHMLYNGGNDYKKVIKNAEDILKGRLAKAAVVNDYEGIDEWKKTIQAMRDFGGKPVKLSDGQKGYIYHVRVNANPKHFLDWDKPLSEQHPAIQHIARNADISAAKGKTKDVLNAWREGNDVGVEATGKDLHYALSDYSENSPAATSILHAAGIPGIRYLDAGSRGPTGNPTYNHVIFDPSIIDIKRRYKRGGKVVNTQKNPVLHHAMSLTNPGKYATNAVNITKTLLKRP